VTVTNPNGELIMQLLPKLALAALLVGSTLAPAFADSGCPQGTQRAEQEGGGVGSLNANTRQAEQEGGGVGSLGVNTRKAEQEGGGVGSLGVNTRKAEQEGGGVGSLGINTRKAEALAAPCK
jgi:hypothetical protein